jgi:hypothetical protein
MMMISKESIMEQALQLWRGSQYRAINGKLLQDKVGNDVAKRYLGRTSMPDNLDNVIQTLRDGMKPITKVGPYYRGCSKRFQKNCHLETFVSVSTDKEDAEAFKDEGVLYTITIASGVRGIPTGVENEVLLEDGCYWEYLSTGNKVTIHPPSSNKGFPYCSQQDIKPAVLCVRPQQQLDLTPEELAELGLEGGRMYKMPRKMTRKYCKKTPCKKMGFTQRASCRPWKNCYKNKK